MTQIFLVSAGKGSFILPVSTEHGDRRQGPAAGVPLDLGVPQKRPPLFHHIHGSPFHHHCSFSRPNTPGKTIKAA